MACGGNHTLAVCAHDTVQQEKEEKKKGYTQRVMSMFTAKPVTVEVPDSRTHSSGPTTAGSGGITPLDRISDGSMSLMNHGSNGKMKRLLLNFFDHARLTNFAKSWSQHQPDPLGQRAECMSGSIVAVQGFVRLCDVCLQCVILED